MIWHDYFYFCISSVRSSTRCRFQYEYFLFVCFCFTFASGVAYDVAILKSVSCVRKLVSDTCALCGGHLIALFWLERVSELLTWSFCVRAHSTEMGLQFLCVARLFLEQHAPTATPRPRRRIFRIASIKRRLFQARPIAFIPDALVCLLMSPLTGHRVPNNADKQAFVGGYVRRARRHLGASASQGQGVGFERWQPSVKRSFSSLLVFVSDCFYARLPFQIADNETIRWRIRTRKTCIS